MVARDQKLDPKRLKQKQMFLVVEAKKSKQSSDFRYGLIRGSVSDIDTHSLWAGSCFHL